MHALNDAVRALAHAPVLLVALDFDGVLAPIVSDPSAARPLPASMDALRGLAAAPATFTALVSGRAVRDLAGLSGAPPEVALVGSHGAEYAGGFGGLLTPERLELRARLADELVALASGVEGVLLEHKPASVAVHVRNAAADAGEELLRLVADGPGRWPGIAVTAGKKVLELAVIDASKGAALDALRVGCGATAVFFAGDDVTDEKAFARLRPGDVGVKVGPGETAAQFRVATPSEITVLLELLLAARS